MMIFKIKEPISTDFYIHTIFGQKVHKTAIVLTYYTRYLLKKMLLHNLFVLEIELSISIQTKISFVQKKYQ